MEPKVIIVTGASRGIGLAVARVLLQASHKVVLIARSAEQLQALKEQYPEQVAYLAADMTVSDVGSFRLSPPSGGCVEEGHGCFARNLLGELQYNTDGLSRQHSD
jgi:Short-chain alcohol dehydrogenase of unknown specificity